MLLGEAIRRMKEIKVGGTVIQVDLSKAFDTVPHFALGPELLAKGVHPAVTNLLLKMYDGAQTVISTGGKSIPIQILRGVKQGDPLSPLLFNIVVDQTITKLSEIAECFEAEGERLGCLAFADDIILLGKDRPSAVRSFEEMVSCLDTLRMEISPPKCGAFSVVPVGKSWIIEDPHIHMRDSPVPYLGPESRFKYLGVRFTPWHGYQARSMKAEFEGVLQMLQKLSIKPHQKVDLLKTYILPHYTYSLTMTVPSINDLEALDLRLRAFLKKCLHLVDSTTESLLYVGNKDGGLGFPRLRSLVCVSAIRAYNEIGKSDDQVMRKVYESSTIQTKLKIFCRHAGVNWPISETSVKRAKRACIAMELKSWRSKVSQGVGRDYFEGDSIGNCWLYEPTLLKPGRFLDALRLRTNTFGNRTSLRRAKIDVPVKCRHCSDALETLGHVLGACPDHKEKIIGRHNDCVKLIADKIMEVSPKWKVLVEPEVESPVGRLKPDLVVVTEDRVFVADVTVRYEDKGSLTRAYTEKNLKYKPILDVLAKEHHVEPGVVLPVVIGSRGAIPKSTTKSLQTLRLATKNTLKTLSLIALRSSIEIANRHLDY